MDGSHRLCFHSAASFGMAMIGGPPLSNCRIVSWSDGESLLPPADVAMLLLSVVL
jgi:hypothetical protein